MVLSIQSRELEEQDIREGETGFVNDCRLLLCYCSRKLESRPCSDADHGSVTIVK